MVAFFVKSNENTYQKGEHSCKYTELSLKRKKGVVKYWYFEVMDSRHVVILVTYLISFIFLHTMIKTYW